MVAMREECTSEVRAMANFVDYGRVNRSKTQSEACGLQYPSKAGLESVLQIADVFRK